MSLEYKDIIKIEIPHICGDPIIQLSFDIRSQHLELSLPSHRIYNIKKADILSRSKGIISIKCNNETEIYLYSDFNILQDIYYYPFISSFFFLDKLKIKSSYETRMEITIPDDFKSLTYLSFIKDESSEKHFKEKETWKNSKATFYYPLFEKCGFKFTLRATGKSINYGIIHIVLPLLIFLLDILIRNGNLPKEVSNNSYTILLAILLTFTPLYIGILQDFLSKSFMALNLGLFLYLKSYLVSLSYILISMLFPNVTIFLILIECIWLLFFIISIRHYFNKGKFNNLSDIIIYKPVIYLLTKRYRKAWKSQINQHPD